MTASLFAGGSEATLSSDASGKAQETAYESKQDFHQREEEFKDASHEQGSGFNFEDIKAQVAHRLLEAAELLHHGSENFREQNQMLFAQYADEAAARVEGISSYIQEKELGEMAQEIEHHIRRRPYLFLGGVFTAGLLAARFIKKSHRP